MRLNLRNIRFVSKNEFMSSKSDGKEVAKLGIYAVLAQLAFGLIVGAVISFSNPDIYTVTNAEQIVNLLGLPFGAVIAFMASDYHTRFDTGKKSLLFIATMFIAPLMVIFGLAKYLLYR